MAAGRSQSQRLYFGVEVFNWCFLSSPSPILRFPGVPLETGGLKLVTMTIIQGTPLGYFVRAGRLSLKNYYI